MSKRNVGIIGVGRIGEVHLRHLVHSGRVTIKYLVDVESVQTKLHDLKQKYNLSDAKVVTTNDIERLFEDKTVEAVFICSPVFGKPHKKCDLVKLALRAGKDVFCEKPIDLEPEEVENCYQTANDSGKTLQCGFDKRFDVSVKKMYHQIKAGEIGKLRVIKLLARELPAWINMDYLKSSGGIIVDSAIHELDLMCWLSGERPDSVVCFGHAESDMFKECNDVQTAMLMLKFPSGLMGYIENIRGAPYGYDQRFEVLGEKGMLKIENPSTSHLQVWNEKGRLLDTITQHGLPRYYASYEAEMHHFLDVLEGNSTCEILPEEVIFNSKLTKYCTKALRSGEIINIPSS